MGALLDALGWVGESIGKPGRAVRGVLAGGGLPAAAHLVPFSDTLGLTNPNDNVTGRQLLEKWGAVGPKTGEGFDSGDLAGMGAEMALDPLTYVGPGLISRGAKMLGFGGKAAEAAAAAGRGTKLAEEAATAGRGAAAAEAAAPVYPGVTPAGRPIPFARAPVYLSESEAARTGGAKRKRTMTKKNFCIETPLFKILI